MAWERFWDSLLQAVGLTLEPSVSLSVAPGVCSYGSVEMNGFARFYRCRVRPGDLTQMFETRVL